MLRRKLGGARPTGGRGWESRGEDAEVSWESCLINWNLNNEEGVAPGRDTAACAQAPERWPSRPAWAGCGRHVLGVRPHYVPTKTHTGHSAQARRVEGASQRTVRNVTEGWPKVYPAGLPECSKHVWICAVGPCSGNLYVPPLLFSWNLL